MQPATKVAVTVTFLRMDERPEAGPALPDSVSLIQLAHCTVPFYRYLYDTTGAAHVWWIRRTLSTQALAQMLAEPDISVHVLYRGGEPAGFFELDRRNHPTINLSYFGLLPHAVGQRLGGAFLSAAVQAAWRPGIGALTVNTCTADHPRALTGYLRAGFQPVRRVEEIWDVPTRLGLVIPRHLLA